MAWSNLPADLLHCISSHLPVVDFLRCSIICTSWNYALANSAHRLRFAPSPWLLLPNDAGEASDTLIFRDLTIEEGGRDDYHRCFSSLSSHISGRRCIGSKDGWLVTLDKTDLQPHLFNPLTKAEISLPSLFTIPEEEFHRIKPEYGADGSIEFYSNEIYPSFCTSAKMFREVYFRKIVISSEDPSGTAVVIYGYPKLLAFKRPIDRTWVLGPRLPSNHYMNEWEGHYMNEWEEFDDVYFNEEEQRFYAITHLSAVLTFDLNGQDVKLICKASKDSEVTFSETKNYITFLSGTLLKVKRENECIKNEIDKSLTTKTTGISVFRFVPTTDTSSCSSSQWISIKDLRDCSLFIGCNNTFVVHHTVAPGIRPNCIYFTDHWEYMSQEETDRDAGFFDLHNNCFHYFLNSNSMPNWPPSIWFTPSLF